MSGWISKGSGISPFTMPILSVFHSENHSLLLSSGSTAMFRGYTKLPPIGRERISYSTSVLFTVSKNAILLPSCSLNHIPLPLLISLIQNGKVVTWYSFWDVGNLVSFSESTWYLVIKLVPCSVSQIVSFIMKRSVGDPSETLSLVGISKIFSILFTRPLSYIKLYFTIFWFEISVTHKSLFFIYNPAGCVSLPVLNSIILKCPFLFWIFCITPTVLPASVVNQIFPDLSNLIWKGAALTEL